MPDTDGEWLECLLVEHLGEIVRNIEFANALFDTDLPYACGAVEDQVLRCTDKLASLFAELWGICQPPQDKMCVEQEPHGSMPKAAARSGGSSSKSAWIRIRPFSAPGVRLAAAPVYRTSFATGTPALPIRTSSPL